MALFGREPVPQKTPVRPTATPANPAPKSSGSTIGKKLVVDGTVSGTEDLVIEGKVRGEINLESDLHVGIGAKIEAKVHARNVVVEGTLVGDVSADVRVELSPSANVDGNIKAPKIVVAEGAVFKGAVDMGGSKGHGKHNSSGSKENG